MTNPIHTVPPPQSERLGAAYAGVTDAELRGIMERVVTRLERLDAEAEHYRDDLRSNTAALGEVKGAVDNLTAAVLVASGRVGLVDERTRTLCEVHEAGFRELREDLMRDRREREADMQAMHSTIEHVGAQLTARLGAVEPEAARVPELGSRLCTMEGALGESPDAEAGRPGRGMRLQVATLWADLQQRGRGNALALGGGALASGPLAYALYELLKYVLKVAGG